MKTASIDLFELIKSLTKSEKFYFKKNISLATVDNKIYLKLFHLIDKSKNYDEKELIFQINYSKKVKAFAVLKHYLYTQIINTVTQKIDNTDLETKTIQHLQQLNFLASKGLYTQYNKLWNKTYIDAKNKELFELKYLLRTQLHNLKINLFVHSNQKEIKHIIDEDDEFFEEYESLQKIKNLYRTIQLYNKQSQIRFLATEINELKIILLNPLLKELPKKYSFHYFYYFHFCIALIKYLIHDYESAFLILEKIKEKMMQNEKLILANPFFSIEFINIYYLISFINKEYDSFFNYLNNPLNKKNTNKQHKANIFAYWSNSNLRYLNTTGKYTEVKNHLKEVDLKIKNYIEDIPIEMKQLLFGSLGISYFIQSNYNEAYYWIKACITTFQINPRQDIQRYIYPFTILIAYELKNKRLLHNECDIAYQFFYRKKLSTNFEILLISFFRKITRANYGRVELKEKFKELRIQLVPIKNDPVLSQAFRYFNFYGWIESKELGISYMEYVQLQQND